MAVVDVVESWVGQDGGWTGDDAGKGDSQVTRKFSVTCDNSPTPDYSGVILATATIPKYGDPHPYNPYLRCRGATATPIGPTFWEVTATYKSRSRDPSDNPLNEPAAISYSTITEDGEVDEDISGKPIVTANGEPISGITASFPDLSMNVSKNISTFNPLAIYEYGRTVNGGTFFGFPPGVVRIANIGATNVFDSDADLAYWTVTCEFIFRRPINTTPLRAWWSRVRHEGFVERYRDTGDSNREKTRHAQLNGKDVSKPIMLKLDGYAETDPAIGHWLEFEVYSPKDYNNLGLGI